MAASELKRTHPATVAVGTVKAALQGVAAAFALAVFGGIGAGPLVGVGAFGLVMVLTLGGLAFSWLKWWFFRYAVIGDDLVIEEGWLVRKRRSIPVTRVQGIDVRADLFMRLMGVTDVIVQTAGGSGGEPEARIGAITLAEAERVRFELLHARRQGTADEPGTAEAPGSAALDGSDPGAVHADPLTRMSDLRGAVGGAEVGRIEPSSTFKMTLPRLMLSAVSSRAVLIVTAAMAVGAFEFVDLIGTEIADDAQRALRNLGLLAIPVLIAGVLLAMGVAMVIVVTRDYGFTARRVEARVETESGLLERRMTGIPVARIQALSIDQAPLQRLLGWASVRAVSAGFGSDDEQSGRMAPSLVPLARWTELDGLLRGLLPEALPLPTVVALPKRAARFYLTVPSALALGAGIIATASSSFGGPLVASAVGLGAVVVLSLVVAGNLLAWRHAAFGTDECALGIAEGMLGRRFVRIGRNRIQSLTVQQSPFQRRARLATVRVVGVSGSSAAVYTMRHVELSDAEELLRWYSASPTIPKEGSET